MKSELKLVPRTKFLGITQKLVFHKGLISNHYSVYIDVTKSYKLQVMWMKLDYIQKKKRNNVLLINERHYHCFILNESDNNFMKHNGDKSHSLSCCSEPFTIGIHGSSIESNIKEALMTISIIFVKNYVENVMLQHVLDPS